MANFPEQSIAKPVRPVVGSRHEARGDNRIGAASARQWVDMGGAAARALTLAKIAASRSSAGVSAARRGAWAGPLTPNAGVTTPPPGVAAGAWSTASSGKCDSCRNATGWHRCSSNEHRQGDLLWKAGTLHAGHLDIQRVLFNLHRRQLPMAVLDEKAIEYVAQHGDWTSSARSVAKWVW